MYKILDFCDFKDQREGYILADVNAAQVRKHLSNRYTPGGLNEEDDVSVMYGKVLKLFNPVR